MESCLSVQVCGSLCDPSLSLSQEEEEEEKAKAKKAIQLLKVCAQLFYDTVPLLPTCPGLVICQSFESSMPISGAGYNKSFQLWQPGSL